MIDVLLTLDVEDVYFDPSEGGDDHPVWMAKTLESFGMTGTFLYVGDKVRRLKENHRRDVAEAMTNHSIGMHVNSNAHPTMPEYTAETGWFEGLSKVREDEQAFAAEFEEFFGRRPEARSRHSCLGCTQSYVVAAEMGIPSIYGVPPSVRSVANIAFCCGALMTPCHGETRHDTPGYLGTGFDRSYSDDRRTDGSLALIDEHVQQCREAGRTFLNIFLGHPVMVRGVDPWFIYYLWPNGRNLSRADADALGAAPIKPASVMPVVKRNFERVCRHIAEHGDIEVIGAPELQRRYGWQKAEISREELGAYAERLLAGLNTDTPGSVPEILLDSWFSPAEILVAMADSAGIWGREQNLPSKVPRRNVLGPTEVPVVCPELPRLTADQMIHAAALVQESVSETGHLPANVSLDGRRVGLGTLLVVIALFYEQVRRGGGPDGVGLPRTSARYPAIAHEIDTYWRRMILEEGTIDPEIDLEAFCRHARLQSWTVKPAHRRP
jgi:hypothetical protein